MKLHLGCGLRYLDGYVNIDYPATEHTVQASIRADVHADIQTLFYPAGSIDEIRLHHVFEHFPRPVALALLCRWRDWLKPGGRLWIETPDVMASFRLMANPLVSFDHKQQVMRHVFGSHEAPWAVHCDGWYKDKFRYTLNRLGFVDITFRTNKWGVLRNLEVICSKSAARLTPADYGQMVSTILKLSTVRVKTKKRSEPEGSEAEMKRVWMTMWEQAYFQKDVQTP